jgi:hypothetical protein
MAIAIPLHDPYEEFEIYLRELFESIKIQTKLPEQIIMGGIKKPTYIDRLFEEYVEFFNLSFKINDSVSTSSNLNLIAKESTCTITKILFQDDFFISAYSIESIKKLFDNQSTIWVASASKNYNDTSKLFERNIRPKISSKMIKGVNSIGTPSVISYRTNDFLPFNEDLKWLLDCEWYLRMHHKYGKPQTIKEFQIASRLHPKQATHAAKRFQNSESQIVQKLHPKSTLRMKFWEYCGNSLCQCTKFSNDQ